MAATKDIKKVETATGEVIGGVDDEDAELAKMARQFMEFISIFMQEANELGTAKAIEAAQLRAAGRPPAPVPAEPPAPDASPVGHASDQVISWKANSSSRRGP